MLLVLLLALFILAIVGGIVISKFLFLILIALLLVAVFRKVGQASA